MGAWQRRTRLGRRGEDARRGHLPSWGSWCSTATGGVAHGELDIVPDADPVVVVRGQDPLDRPATALPAEAVTPGKAARIRRFAAIGWPSTTGWVEVRFDVVAVLVEPGAAVRVEHLRGGVLMGARRAHSVALQGVDGHLVEIEADIGRGLPGVHLVGLPDTALQEAQTGSGPRSSTRGGRGRATDLLALSPATLRKAGSGFDLALACAVLAADGDLPQPRLSGTVLLGELALDGRLRPVRGVLPACWPPAARGCRRVVVPAAALAEAALVEWTSTGPSRLPTCSLAAGRAAPSAAPGPAADPATDTAPPISPMSSGRTMRGRPARSPRPAGTTCCSRAAGHGQDDARAAPASGLLPAARRRRQALGSPRSTRSPDGCRTPALITTVPPLVAPHHTTSMAALVGGGQRPGPARGGLAGPSRRAVPRRGARVGAAPARRAAHAAGGRRGQAVAHRGHGASTRPGSNSCSPPTRARARRRTTATACARRSCAAATSAGCPGRCSIGWTCGRGCCRSPRWPRSRIPKRAPRPCGAG